MSSPSSQLTHTLVYMHGSALSDTLTHRAPEASINLALRVQNNLLIISHSNSLQSPLDNCLNTHPAAGCNQTVMRYCFYFPGHVCVCIFRHGNACVYLFMQYALPKQRHMFEHRVKCMCHRFISKATSTGQKTIQLLKISMFIFHIFIPLFSDSLYILQRGDDVFGEPEVPQNFL